MSIFAGVYARRPDRPVPEGLAQQLRQAMSRHPDDADAVQAFADDRALLLTLDIGALGGQGSHADAGSVAFVAGAPLLHPADAAEPLARDASLAAIAHDLAADGDAALRACRGTYCAFVYDTGARRLHLMTDKSGVRPIYCWVSPDFIVFATALRIIEAVPFCKKTLGMQGIAEAATFGFALGDRTPYENVFSMLAGEHLVADGGELRRPRYWRWDEAMPPSASDLPAHERLHRTFRQAVRIRLGADRATAAFLSGGLDSRVIVAELRDAGAAVFTANYAPPGSQDQVLGKMISDRLGTHNTPLVRTAVVEGDPYSKATVHEWLKLPAYAAAGPARPRVLWSGDGGSVGLGHVYLNQDMVDSLRAGDVDASIRQFFAYNRLGLSVKLFKSHVGSEMNSLMMQGVRSELQALAPADPGRAWYLFLMMNDQRRHLFNHFESMDLGRLEFELPFFDAEFLADVMREPFDPFLRHGFYVQWLQQFNPAVAGTPWQAYPRHVPCPHPLPEEATYQWDKMGAAELRRRIQAALANARELLAPDFNRQYLGTLRVRLFMLALRLSGKDYLHQLRAPTLLHRYWTRTLAD
ncbi:asparagine synthase-related protein [Telluria beijingensis]|uniref:asparagine synthase-related protein n=1 Tax=Telluria beijingensis TaxID=3068633 RepID=UPI002795C25B|nr:asparagine synthase-related protein [Massilia sp. REN29]